MSHTIASPLEEGRERRSLVVRQLGRVPVLCNPSGVHDDDLVRREDCVDSVSDGHHCDSMPLDLLAQRLLDALIYVVIADKFVTRAT